MQSEIFDPTHIGFIKPTVPAPDEAPISEEDLDNLLALMIAQDAWTSF